MRCGAFTAGIDEPTVFVGIEDAVDIEQKGELEPDQADGRVLALRYALGDDLAASIVQGQGNAGGIAGAGVDDVEGGLVRS